MRYLFILLFSLSIYASDNLDLGLPSKVGQVIDRKGYAFCYSEKYEQPLWVSYKLTQAEALSKVAKRKNNFKADKVITTGSASLSDYRRSGFDRGHLAPAADMAWSKDSMSESFFMTNMSPQVPGFNRGIWKKLESLVRNWSTIDKELYIITGPIITPSFQTIGKDKVAIPQYYYKIAVDLKGPQVKAIAFILPNKASKKPLSDFVVSINRVEEVTGLDFLTNLSPSLEEALEKEQDLSLWNFKAKVNRQSI